MRTALATKHDPLVAATVQQLVELLLPATARVDLSVGRPNWFLPREHRSVERNTVASQYLELEDAGGMAGWLKLGCQWNGAHRVMGFDFDYEANPDHDGRGCNHPDSDGGNALAHLRRLVLELTGGDLITLRSPRSNGVWALAAVPAGVDGRALAQHVLRQLSADGFHTGLGRLEAPMSNARLPLVGYRLDGHQGRSWIEQVGELADWLEQQVELVQLRKPLPYEVVQLTFDTPITAEVMDHCGVNLSNLRWLPGYGSNGFLRAAATRMVEAGHGIESSNLMAALVHAHPGWQACSSDDSKRTLGRWCRRWLKWAMANVAGAPVEPAGPSNVDRHRDWCDRVKAGVAAAVRDGRQSVTAVIEFLRAGFKLSKRLLWERVDLIRQGIELELELLEQEREMPVEQGCLGVTPTRLIPMGVSTGVEPAALPVPAVPCLESINPAVPAPPAAMAEQATDAVPGSTQPEPADPGLIERLKSARVAAFAGLRARLKALACPAVDAGGIRPASTPPASGHDPIVPIRPVETGQPVLDRQRQQQRDELARWLAATG